MEFYCEIEGNFRPKFFGWKKICDTPEEAVEFFKKVHGTRLEVVYDENFNFHYKR